MNIQQATLGGGCFWCLDAAYQRVKGVRRSVAGYAGGRAADPTYEQVHAGTTGHAEVVQLDFDAEVISYDTILNIFWVIHNPTTLNQQGNDVGEEYRSIILYHDQTQKEVAEASLAMTQKLWDDPIVTEVVPYEIFYPAEEEHQDFFQKHPEFAYCQVVINPKLHKLQERYGSLLR